MLFSLPTPCIYKPLMYNSPCVTSKGAATILRQYIRPFLVFSIATVLVAVCVQKNSIVNHPSAITGKSLNDKPVFVYEPRSAVLTSAEAPPPQTTAPIPNASATPTGDANSAKLFIYNHESGNRTTARNAGGCLGLGQACPGSKLLAVCPDLNDYACQDAFFTNYAVSRYGSWEGAKAFWDSHNWW